MFGSLLEGVLEAKSDPNPQISARPGSTGKGREALPRDCGIGGLRDSGLRDRGFRDCGQRVLLNHLSPRGLVGFEVFRAGFFPG